MEPLGIVLCLIFGALVGGVAALVIVCDKIADIAHELTRFNNREEKPQ